MNRSDLENQAERAARAERFGEHRAAEARRARRTIEMERLKQVGMNLGGQVDEQVRKRPYVVVGAAAGVGFIAGSLFGSRLGQMLLAVGIGFALKSMLEGELTPEGLRERLDKFTGEDR